MTCAKAGLGLCATHPTGRGYGAHLVEADGLCDVGRELRNATRPSALASLRALLADAGPSGVVSVEAVERAMNELREAAAEIGCASRLGLREP